MEIIVTSTKSVGKISNFKLAHAPYQGPIDYCITNVTSDRLRLKDINEFVKKDKYGRKDLWYFTWERMELNDTGNTIHKFYEVSYNEITEDAAFSQLTEEEKKHVVSATYEIYLRMVAILNTFCNYDPDIFPDRDDTAAFITKMLTNHDSKKDSSYDYEDLVNNYIQLGKTLEKIESSDSNESNKKFVVYNLDRDYNHRPDFHFEIHIDEKFVTMGYLKDDDWYFSTKYHYKECSEAQHITNLRPVFDE